MTEAATFGGILQYWRKARHLTQLALAIEADVSPRHVCFVETGRAKPSRDMVMLLASVLDVPLRERNMLLLAAGFAPIYRESNLEAAELAPVRAALEAILRQQEPYPAVVLDRHWDIVRTNTAATAFFSFLLDPGPAAGRGSAPSSAGPPPSARRPNVLRLIFDERALKPWVANWPSVAEALITRVRREAVGGVEDAETIALVEEVLAYPGVPKSLRKPNLETPLLPVVPVSFAKGGKTFAFFSAVTTLGTPQDITVQELRIESFFPANAATEAASRALTRFPAE